jgi:Icc-related predicted phosphoesterase
MEGNSMRLVLLSDTHNQLQHIKVPDGDVLVHAGDLTCRGTMREVVHELHVMAALPHRRKVLVAGNHDWLFERDGALARSLVREFDYLQNSEVEIGGVRFWGSPVQPAFADWAFNRERGADIKRYWDMIPAGIDVLVTHGPPSGYLDGIERDFDENGEAHPYFEHVGCVDLFRAVARVRPRLHVFGHIHEARGRQEGFEQCAGVDFVNAACVDEGNRLIAEAPMVYDL